jgi:hypothetical protein
MPDRYFRSQQKLGISFVHAPTIRLIMHDAAEVLQFMGTKGIFFCQYFLKKYRTVK